MVMDGCAMLNECTMLDRYVLVDACTMLDVCKMLYECVLDGCLYNAGRVCDAECLYAAGWMAVQCWIGV